MTYSIAIEKLYESSGGYDNGRDNRTVGDVRPAVILITSEGKRKGKNTNKKAAFCLKKLKQYCLKDNSTNTAPEDLAEKQVAEFPYSQNKKVPKYDMNNGKVVMPMHAEKAAEC